MTHTYLFEIGLEEMPAQMILGLEQQLQAKTELFLAEVRLAYETIETFSTPRRLAVRINGLAERQEDQLEVIKGPAKKIAQDHEGNWTEAAIGFSKGQGVEVDDIVFKDVDGVPYVFIEKQIVGQATEAVIGDIVTIAKQLSFPVSMKWGTRSERYIRPVHWLISLLDDSVVPTSLFGIEASNTTWGHRFLGEEILLEHPDQYEEKLLEQYVIAHYQTRRTAIQSQIRELCQDNGWQVPNIPSLLEEVTNLVEYPTVFYGQFDAGFLEVPEKILETSMADHQRYFPVRDESTGAFLPYFIGVRNGDEAYLEQVVKGNEKVLVARLEDAKFFYEEDKQVTIEAFVKQLETSMYQEKLGHLRQKQVRVKEIALALAEKLNMSSEVRETLQRAGDIYKFDLMTNVVGEFSKLQGYIGSVYARERGESETVAQAIEEHYMPTHANGSLPQSEAGVLLALADKLEMLMLFFAIGLIPTGSNDPHALRRNALGVIRILVDHQLSLSLGDLMDDLMETITVAEDIKAGFYAHKEDLLQFFKGRLDQLLEDESNTPYDIRQAVLSTSTLDPLQVIEKAKVLTHAQSETDYKLIGESFTRINNMADGLLLEQSIEPDKFQTASERALYEALVAAESDYEQHQVAESRFDHLRQLSPLIDQFFEENMVNADDSLVKANRQMLLKRINHLAQDFAVFSHLVVK
ncbi:glycine--tRNA ligase subunit beta [Dolosigranulum pigrum]|uniref:Glycine--tRNA ligase beta subunit n=1 Tax=Dolosigranulum pigrum ATCC 51524 TaxID=883103 RepID=H3NEU2_9LACT|nr:glycine--tRNA ligase subunit beta [Dolosigranulum pigrum]EHR32957.1 glycine-tRNA ligase, beta subunit [Dolosigranulum pigrum ATCC 51524]